VKLIPRKPINADDNLGRGMDMALVTLVFLGIGYVLDRSFDTKPVFMIGLVVFAVIGQFVKMWYAYDSAMQRLEDERRMGATAGRTRAEEGSAA
jgi:F0F1-type ATP synthase assembly protein I